MLVTIERGNMPSVGEIPNSQFARLTQTCELGDAHYHVA